MVEKYILASLLDVGVGLYFYFVYWLASITSYPKVTWWKFPVIFLAFGSFGANVNFAWDVVDWLGFKKGTDGQSYAYFIWMTPMCLGILSAMYFFKIRKDILKKKKGLEPLDGAEK